MGSVARALASRTGGAPLTDGEALGLATANHGALGDLLSAAAAVRDRAYGGDVTFSPKVFLPLTNICPDRCDYCSFRRSPGDPGAWTMTADEVAAACASARDAGCAEALLCLGDKPERGFSSYRATLARLGHGSTVDYLHAAGVIALDRGLLPHTNAGLLSKDEMARLREVNVSLGLMLENVSPRLCEPGMPHHRAPDKRPEARLAMIAEAGALRIPFTTGILIGIGETRRERVESLLAIRDLHREHGHVQEVIVQNFRAHAGTAMENAPEPDRHELAHAIACARLILDDEVSVQAPPNLMPPPADTDEPRDGTALLLDCGINDFGGISPVTPDYINPRHPWPHLAGLSGACADAGFALLPRLAIYDRYLEDARTDWLDPGLATPVDAARRRSARILAGALSPAPPTAAPTAGARAPAAQPRAHEPRANETRANETRANETRANENHSNETRASRPPSTGPVRLRVRP